MEARARVTGLTKPIDTVILDGARQEEEAGAGDDRRDLLHGRLFRLLDKILESDGRKRRSPDAKLEMYLAKVPRKPLIRFLLPEVSEC
jgi:hypothetical protein